MATNLTRALLLYRTGQPQDFRLPEGDAVLGFGGDSAVRLPMEGVSRAHAKITFDGKDYWIEDVGSSNGTFLNGIPVGRRERLRHLDVLALGRFTELIFVRRAGEQARVTRLGIRAAWLETLNGEESGSRIEIPRGSLTIGRSPSNSVIADSQLVSKVHARLERTPLQIVLTDLHSANGTFMGTEKIESMILKDGDEFTLGGARTFRVRIEEGNVETSGVTPSATVRSGVEQSLPTDWKTRLEWSPEEIAVWEDSRKKSRSADTAPRSPAKTVDASQPRTKPPAPSAAPPVEAPEKGEAAAAVSALAGSPARRGAAPGLAGAKPPAPNPRPVASPAEKGEAAVGTSPAVGSPEKGLPAPRADTKPPSPSGVRSVVLPSENAEPPPSVVAAAAISSEQSAVAPQARASASPPAQPPPTPATDQSTSAIEATTALPSTGDVKARVHLDGKTRTFALRIGNHEVGRLPGMTVRLEGPQISRQHAIIRVSETDVVLEDLGSGNGTFVNMERITVPRRLANADLVQFGDIGFHVRFASDTEGEKNP